MECGRTNTAIDQSTREGQSKSLVTQPSNIECWTGQWPTLEFKVMSTNTFNTLALTLLATTDHVSPC